MSIRHCTYSHVHGILLAIALFVPVVTAFQEFVFRVVLSLAAAGIGASIPGFLNLHFDLPAGSIEAGGALALFALSYAVNPPALVSQLATPGSVTPPAAAVTPPAGIVTPPTAQE
jgi:hypothetical protein